MGQKVHPYLFRLATIFDWKSKWYARGKEYAKFIEQDMKLKKWVITKLKDARIARLEVERSRGSVLLSITSAKPGLIIGRGGAGLEELKKGIKKHFPEFKENSIEIRIHEVKVPNLSAQVLVDQMIGDIEKRMPFRRVLKTIIDQALKAGAKGVKVQIAGRLNGAEIARTEMLSSGKVPLQTLRANIDYSRGTAHTTYGTIGVAVWVYTGEVFDVDAEESKA